MSLFEWLEDTAEVLWNGLTIALAVVTIIGIGVSALVSAAISMLPLPG